MGVFDHLKGKRKTRGYIGHFRLDDWWFAEFNESEREHMCGVYEPFGDSDVTLTDGDLDFTSETLIAFLWGLSSWFTKKEDRYLAHKILDKAEESIDDTTDILDVHFLLEQKIKTWYKDRDQPSALEKAIEACKRQIEIGPLTAKAFRAGYNGPLPIHKGYEQLAIVYEIQKEYAQAIGLCDEAVQQGWAGDWKKRIDRCTRKLDRGRRQP
jgi:tetratricopeptide (TPR) repeat protein